MNLKTYTERHSQVALAKLIGEAPSFVNQWVKGKRPVPAMSCVAIEKATSGEVTRAELRPNDYHLIWPELAQAHTSIAQPATQTVATEGA